jgi:hypothetical protein
LDESCRFAEAVVDRAVLAVRVRVRAAITSWWPALRRWWRRPTPPPGRRRRCLDWRGLDVAANGRIHWEELPCNALLWDCARIHGAAERFLFLTALWKEVTWLAASEMRSSLIPWFTCQDKQRLVDMCFSGQVDLICMDHATLIRSPIRTFVEWGRTWASLVRQPDPATEYHILRPALD